MYVHVHIYIHTYMYVHARMYTSLEFTSLVKDDENSRPLNLVQASDILDLGIDGGYQCVAQLSFN